MAKETSGEGEEAPIEISGDTLAIADAIYGGLSEIAGAIRAVAKALEADVESDEAPETYLDGTRIR